MKYIQLGTKNKFVIVDDDFSLGIKWTLGKLGYAWAYERGKSHSTRKRLYLHRLIMKASKGQYVDHVNGNKLDNRRENLRICTNQQNVANHKIKKNNTSGFRGVYFWERKKQGRRGIWRASIEFNRKVNCLGYFKDKRHAALMYDFWSTHLFGKFGRTNFKVVFQYTSQ